MVGGREIGALYRKPSAAIPKKDRGKKKGKEVIRKEKRSGLQL